MQWFDKLINSYFIHNRNRNHIKCLLFEFEGSNTSLKTVGTESCFPSNIHQKKLDHRFVIKYIFYYSVCYHELGLGKLSLSLDDKLEFIIIVKWSLNPNFILNSLFDLNKYSLFSCNLKGTKSQWQKVKKSGETV